MSKRELSGECGICLDCKEWTDVGASCCGRGVYFEGGFVADFGDDEQEDEPGDAT